MSEKPDDGVVVAEIEDFVYLTAEDFLPTLPNTHEGSHVEDIVLPKSVRMDNASGPPTSAAPEMQRLSEGVSLQSSGDAAKPSNCNSGNAPAATSSQNIQAPRIQMSQELLPGVSVTLDQVPPLQQHSHQPQQHSQFQRSQVMLPPNLGQHLNNVAQNTNMQLGSHVMNKTSAHQLQLLQQREQQIWQQRIQNLSQSQQQLQQTMQRNMVPDLGNVGMGGNNMTGHLGLGNVMGIVGGSGSSTRLGTVSNIGNMSENPMTLSSASNISPQQAAYMKMKTSSQSQSQSRSNLLGNPQSSIGGIPGTKQMQPGSDLSMLGPSLSRYNMNQMQSTGMGPPKVLPGMNIYMNQQQQKHNQLQQLGLQPHQMVQLQEQQKLLWLQQHQMVQLQQQMQQLQQQMQQQQPQPQPQHQQKQLASPQQMRQRTPMSSQGVNKSNSVNNA